MASSRKGLAGHLVPRAQVRVVEQRSEERQVQVVDRAALFFRGREYVVPVLNLSTRGAMIEAPILPRIGENMVIKFEGCARMQAFVRWVRDGRIGLNFGHEIVLG